MNVLIDEYPLVVLPTLAELYGLNEAIVIQQVHYWCNKAKTYDDGYTWVYNSIPEWKKQFPFWSERTIFSILKRLREDGLLIAERKSENHWDQTLYYRPNYSMLRSSISQPLQDRLDKPCKITLNTETTRDYFAEFWKLYPKRVAKEAARKAFSKLDMTDELFDEIAKAIIIQELDTDDLTYVPYPASWLNARRWEDEITVSSTPNLPFGRILK
jgi:hypothetical protein